MINNRIHDFFKLKPTAIYMKWYKLYSILNNLPNPPKEYFEFLEKVTYIWNNQDAFGTTGVGETKYNDGQRKATMDARELSVLLICEIRKQKRIH